MSDRTAWRIASENGGGACSGRSVERTVRSSVLRFMTTFASSSMATDVNATGFVADRPNQLWLTDIKEHNTACEGKLYLCAVKDVFSGRIVGYSIDSRMKASLAVRAVRNAVSMRGNVIG